MTWPKSNKDDEIRDLLKIVENGRSKARKEKKTLGKIKNNNNNEKAETNKKRKRMASTN